MGQLRFRVKNADSFDPKIWQSAFVSGLEGIPWAGKNVLKGELFTIERSVHESGKLSIVWPTLEYGPLLLSTASLRCQEEPYNLVLELARGTIHRIRGRAYDWQRIGLKLPDCFQQQIEQSLDKFIQAILAASDLNLCTSLAQEAIDLAISASKPLGRAFISQSLQARHQSEKQLTTLLGVKLIPNSSWEDRVDELLPAINTIQISMELGQLEGDSNIDRFSEVDKQLEWARNNAIRVFGGPLLNLQPHAVPKWLYLFNDFESMYDAACKHAAQVVERYRGQVHLWTAAAGLNCQNTLGLNDEQVLHLSVGVIQAVRRADPKTPVIVTIDCPWAEYLGEKLDGISPLHFADALVRADLGLSGLGLELNLNLWPHGSLPRDLVDISDLIDHWNILGLPLLVHTCTPCSLKKDRKATSKATAVSNWTYPEEILNASASGMGNAPNCEPTEEKKRLPINGLEVIQMLLAKTNVHGIIWNQFSDTGEHAYPNAGLIDPTGERKGILEAISRLRKLHVQ